MADVYGYIQWLEYRNIKLKQRIARLEYDKGEYKLIAEGLIEEVEANDRAEEAEVAKMLRRGVKAVKDEYNNLYDSMRDDGSKLDELILQELFEVAGSIEVAFGISLIGDNGLGRWDDD